MSTEEVTAYRVHCDAPGCAEVSDPSVSLEDADESAAAAGWFLADDEGADMCPFHKDHGVPEWSC